MRRGPAGRPLRAALLAALLAAGLQAPAAAGEVPSLATRVAARELPPVGDRLPQRPLVLQTDLDAVYGGEWRVLIGTPKDVKLLSVYGYARLVRWDRDYRLVPDIAERVEVTEGRVFTFHLRRGHRWSDGVPFTSGDFCFWWRDIANHPILSPSGPPPILRVAGELPKVECPDRQTVRYTWSQPNNLFLLDLASASPTVLYRPAHYLKRFHAAYTDPQALARLTAAERRRSWAALFHARDAMYVMDNPDLPTLQPWRLTTAPPADVFTAERNPYFHRVDQQGRQLPYLDRVRLTLVDKAVIPIKVSTGEADLQARYLSFNDYVFLKRSEQAGGYRVHLWPTASTSTVTLYPNLTTADPVMRTLLQDRRFRQALSLAIHRAEINKLLFYGLGTIGQNTVLRRPGSRDRDDDLRMAYARFDPVEANRLLDAVGLTARDGDGFRRRPDGRRLDLIIETSGESTEQSDVLELIKRTWAEIGVELLIRPSQRQVYRLRVFSGEAMMSVGVGAGEFGLPTPEMSPGWLAPISEEHLQWSRWGLYYESRGRRGDAPTLPAAARLVALYQRWLVARDRNEQARIWNEMLDINRDEVFTIGILGNTLQPVVVHGLRGVPDQAVYAWDPGAHFGYLSPDTFFWPRR